MPDWVWSPLRWALVAAAFSPIALALGWALVEGLLFPRLIPRDAIDALAEAVMREHPEDPEGWAFREEHAAWVRSRAVEQGQWRRVRRRIRARMREEEASRAAWNRGGV
ncbi:hypothetical protein [Methylobacterium sp. SyP6R]|uniref:hypothetical protein n=1 Tax=Methylobacterium sp. SyP6R TaxID=2718876 RepID=UPI001F27E8C8|nr:hypothetical protein [Methylobacterium sp. SyP6R]MCF4126311.1 hypothetical protein [Methylobacterium sp. SyP6R]